MSANKVSIAPKTYTLKYPVINDDNDNKMLHPAGTEIKIRIPKGRDFDLALAQANDDLQLDGDYHYLSRLTGIPYEDFQYMAMPDIKGLQKERDSF